MSLDWELIANGLRTGRYNLLLGAGASLDSESGNAKSLYHGTILPSSGRLREDLSALMPNMKTSSSLHRLHLNLSPEQKREHITLRFADCRPGATLQKITQFRWNRIFTLNIDDALENAYAAASAPAQKPVPINYTEKYSEPADKTQVQIVHLHGFSKRPDDDYIFDLKSYAGAISDNHVWSHILGDILRSEPFFVLGTSLEEPDLEYFLSERDPCNDRADRPPSVLVEPSPDDGTQTDCNRFALTLFKGTALQFLVDADKKVPNRPSPLDVARSNLGDLAARITDQGDLSLFHSYFERVPETKQTTSPGAANFALGHEPTWVDIQSDCDVARGELATRLESTIESTKSGGVCLLLGEPGAGKTTLLKRVALSLAKNTTCLWRRAPGRIQLDIASRVIRSFNGRVVVFIDNFSDHVREVAEWRRQLGGADVVFVGAERNYSLEHLRRILGETPTHYMSVGVLGQSAAKALIDSYVALGLSEIQKGLEQNQAKQIAGDQIAVACCRIINKFAPIEQVIDKSLNHATARERQCYLLVALAARCAHEGIPYNALSGLVRGYGIEAQTGSNASLPIRFHDVGDHEMVLPLNDVISQGILSRASSRHPDEMLKVFNSVASSIHPYVNLGAIRRGDPAARLASKLFDYDAVVKPLLGVGNAGTFYDTGRKQWSWNSRFWHQIALQKLDAASQTSNKADQTSFCNLAVQHARHAKTIEQRHEFTLTTIGKVLFQKMQILAVLNPAEIEEAIKALALAIQIESEKRRLSVHPFVVIFDGVTSLAHLKPAYSPAQRATILSMAERARAAFGYRTDIVDRIAQVERLI